MRARWGKETYMPPRTGKPALEQGEQGDTNGPVDCCRAGVGTVYGAWIPSRLLELRRNVVSEQAIKVLVSRWGVSACALRQREMPFGERFQIGVNCSEM